MSVRIPRLMRNCHVFSTSKDNKQTIRLHQHVVHRVDLFGLGDLSLCNILQVTVDHGGKSAHGVFLQKHVARALEIKKNKK
jgi:hypothetical protein